MTPSSPRPPHDNVIRLSLAGLTIAALAMIGSGLLGGWLAQQIWRGPLPPLTNTNEPLVSTVQQVTISPNTATTESVQGANRSVVLIARADGTADSSLASGVVLTNDGLIATTANPATASLAAFDHEGRPLALDRVGRDEVFGITYFKIPRNVVVPLDLRADDPAVGHELTLLSRHPVSFLPTALEWSVRQFNLPASATAPGLQRLLQGPTSPDTSLTGSPLLDDEGKIAGLVLDPRAGSALPVSYLRASFNRLTANQRERNPYTALGVSLTYTFTRHTPTDPITFAATVTAVTPNSIAAAAGLARGDLIVAINRQPLAWEQSVATALTGSLPLPVTVRRQGADTVVTLQTAASPAATSSPAASPSP